MGLWMVALEVAQRRLQGEQQDCRRLKPGLIHAENTSLPWVLRERKKRGRLGGSEGVSKPWDIQSSSPTIFAHKCAKGSQAK